MSSACALRPAALLVGTSAGRVEDIAWDIWGNCSPVTFKDTQPSEEELAFIMSFDIGHLDKGI